MAHLKTPFDYGTILIGDEVIYRGLKQQHEYEGKGEYGMTWDSNDAAAQTAAMTQGNAMKANDFTIPSGMRSCPVDPPCPWPKNTYDLNQSLLMPMMMSNDGVTTYNIKVAEQTGSPSTVYVVGNTLASYNLDQSQLDPGERSQFLYYDRVGTISFLGDAIIVIEKVQNRAIVNTFTYLFKLI